MDDYEKSKEVKKEIAKKMLEKGMNEWEVMGTTGISIRDIKAIKSKEMTEEEKSIMLFDLKAENKEIKDTINTLEDDIRTLKSDILKIKNK